MPTGIYKRTKKMITGKHMLGRKLSDITKGNMSKARMGDNNPSKRIDVRKKLSKVMLGNTNGFKKGHIGLVGKKNPNWKNGISKQKDYNRIRQKEWRNKNREYTNFLTGRRRIKRMNADGSHTLGEWQHLKAQYNWTCPCCKRSEPKIKLTQDHIIPISKGGSDNIENIQPLCGSCNCKKYTKIIKYKI